MKSSPLKLLIFLTILLIFSCKEKDPYSCVSCHIKLHPSLVADFKSSKMSEHFSCEKCHGIKHSSEKDVEKVFLPVVQTCSQCHEEKANQYLKGKHSLAFKAIEILPFTHSQPEALIKGRKGCGGCHGAGYNKISDRYGKNKLKPRYGMGCINCHTRHKFSKSEAQEPESCKTCHTGFDHAQFEMWSGSKHGTIYLSQRAKGIKNGRVPKCQTCHMEHGNHNVITAWGFFAVRGFEKDKKWKSDRDKIFQAMGLLDKNGKKTSLYKDVIKLNMLRENKEEFYKIQSAMVKRCLKCHSKNFTLENFKTTEALIRETDKLMAEAIGIVEKKDGKIPDLFRFYNVESVSKKILFEMFMDHRMKSFQAGFHINPDYSTWYGYARLKQDIIRLKSASSK